MPRVLVHLVFLLSGASGLIYQVIWVRELGLVFGNTVYSASLVTAVFMCGLGLGSFLAGRRADVIFPRDPNAPLRWYAAAELTIAALGLALAYVLPALGELSASLSSYATGANGWHTLSFTSSIARYLFAIVLLGPSTFLMGATLPLLIRWLIGTDVERIGWRIGLLYGVNTLGAALGSFFTDLALVPKLGVHDTQLVAVAINAIAGVVAALIARRVHAHAPAAQTSSASEAEVHGDAPEFRSTAAALFLTGFAALGMELVWFRYASSVLGAYRAMFSTLLAVILVGIVIGSIAGGWLAERTKRPLFAWMTAEVAIAFVSLGAIAILDNETQSAYLTALAPTYAEASPAMRALLEHWTNLRFVLLLALPASIAMGFAFPLANAHVQRTELAIGRRAGTLYLANTAGNVAGALVTGFVFLPIFGAQITFLFLAVLTVASLLPLSRAGGAAAKKPFAVLLFAGAIPLVAFSMLPADHLLRATVPALSDPAIEIAGESEGVNETIVITREPGIETKLITNGHPMSSTNLAHQRYMRAFVHLPMFIMDRATRALVICFGVGNTANAVSIHRGIEQIDIADLSRHVLEQAHHFEESNGGVLKDPRTKVFVNDGRHHLAMQPAGTYDLITLEPPPISFAGVSALYSREFYALASSRLREGGMLTQWLPAYQVREELVLMMVRAFADVFPNAVLLSGEGRELILMGRRGGSIAIDAERIRAMIAANPALAEDLRRINLERPIEIAGTFAGDAETLVKATADVGALSDDRPLIEYSQISNITETTLPPALFDSAGFSKFCPTCAGDEFREYVDLLAHLYRSPKFLRFSGYLDRNWRLKIFEPYARTDAIERTIADSNYLVRLFPSPKTSKMRAAQLEERHELEAAALEYRRALYYDPQDEEAKRRLCAVEPKSCP